MSTCYKLTLFTFPLRPPAYMQGQIVNLQGSLITSGERNHIEQIKGALFPEAVF